ncbi:deoxyribonuclease IV [Furfurilactobacillus sp. WILCCON 0119]
MNRRILLGAHVSIGGKGKLFGAAQEAIKYNANAMLVYTGAPHNSVRVPISQFHVQDAHELMSQNEIKTISVHAPFLINMASMDRHKWEYSVATFISEVNRARELGAETFVFHPGSHVGISAESGLSNVIRGLNAVSDTLLAKGPDRALPKILIETMAGKGNELGSSFGEVASILAGVSHPDMFGVCIDTCHIFDAGYDIKNHYEEVLIKLDQMIGLDKIQAIHLNDSKFGLGSHKDRHANIGLGEIGFETLNRLAHDERFFNVPKLLETPGHGRNKYLEPPYEEEIALLRGNLSLEKFVLSDKLH